MPRVSRSIRVADLTRVKGWGGDPSLLFVFEDTGLERRTEERKSATPMASVARLEFARKKLPHSVQRVNRSVSMESR